MSILEEVREGLSKIIEECHKISFEDEILGMKRNDFERIMVLSRHHLKPVTQEVEGGGSSWWYVCSECHSQIDSKDRYCRQCGRPIERNENPCVDSATEKESE